MPLIEGFSQTAEHEQLNFLTAMVDQADIGLAVVDVNLRIKFWNQWVEQCSAINAEQAIGAEFFELFPEILDTRLHQALRTALDFGFPALISNVFNRTPLPLYQSDSESSASAVRERIQQQLRVTPFRVDNGRRFCLLQINDVTPSVTREKTLEAQVSKRKESEALLIIQQNELEQTVDQLSREVRIREQGEKDLEIYNKKLELSNERLNQFAFVASHDLQEPLRKIETFSGFLTSELEDDLSEEHKDYFNRMRNAVKRMRKLITVLLDYSRVTSKETPLKPVSLSTVVDAVIDDFAATLQKNKFRIDVSNNLPTVMADETQIQQLFLNLISNGLKFKNPDVEPRLKIFQAEDERPANTVTIVIEDNGIGIDKKYHQQIFGIFQRLHGRDKYEGTGIGLAICWQVVENCGATITLESEAGKGTRFFITFPTGG